MLQTLEEDLVVNEYILNGISVKEFECSQSQRFQIAAICDHVEPETRAAIGMGLSEFPEHLQVRLATLTMSRKKVVVENRFKKNDCPVVRELGHLFLSLENISLLAALQITQFHGQAASIQHVNGIDVSCSYVLPSHMQESPRMHDLVRGWFDLYQETHELLIEHFVRQEIEEYDAQKQAFAISSAFLPIAIETNVIIASDIKSLIALSRNLQVCESQEMQMIGMHLLAVIHHLCPMSVRQEDVQGDMLRAAAYHVSSFFESDLLQTSVGVGEKRAGISRWQFRAYDLIARMQGKSGKEIACILRAEEIGRYGHITCGARLSFRSLRDIMMCRSSTRMWSFAWQMIDNRFLPPRFCRWYIENIPKKYREDIRSRVSTQLSMTTRYGVGMYIRFLGTKPAGVILPLGIDTFFEMTASLATWMRVFATYSQSDEHPEIRDVVRMWGRSVFNRISLDYKSIGLGYLETDETDHVIDL